MDNKAFKKAVEVLVKEKGIDENKIYEAMELALVSGYKRNYNSLPNVRVNINKETGEIQVFSFKTVVKDPNENQIINQEEVEIYEKQYIELINSDIEMTEEEIEEEEKNAVYPIYFDDRIHITLKEAQKIVSNIQIGETIEEEITPRDFGRVATSTAKQVVIQKIREAERESIINAFDGKQDELLVGIVAMEDVRNYYIDLGQTQGILPKSETIPGETIKMGSSLKVYVTKVESNTKGPLILLSRNHYGFVKRLLELEIPEINEGIILVYGVAREAGVRTKIAVYSENRNVDAVGSCIGEQGNRINRIIKELNGEKIDVINYENEASKFIENALSPAREVSVFITDEQKREALVIADNDNLSLAIGKKGINVRLASRLTHHKIDVKTKEQAQELGINIL